MKLTELDWPRRIGCLSLRPLAEPDWDTMYAHHSKPAAHEWIVWAPTSRDEFGERMSRSAENPRVLDLAIELDGAMIGDCFLEVGDGWAQDDLTEAKGCQAELGYVIDPDHAGRGYATEVATELVRIGFAELGLRRLTAGCFADNHASRRVLAKSGLRLEGLTRRECLHRDRGWLDGCQYAVLAEEWAG